MKAVITHFRIILWYLLEGRRRRKNLRFIHFLTRICIGCLSDMIQINTVITYLVSSFLFDNSISPVSINLLANVVLSILILRDSCVKCYFVTYWS
jgi:hypothetical protein